MDVFGMPALNIRFKQQVHDKVEAVPSDSEDEDGDSYVECISDHKDDLLPTILQQKAMAEVKSAQEEYAPKNPLPLTTPTIEEIAPTTLQTTTSPSQTPSEDTAKKTPPPTPMIEETAPITS
ncbi:hypothetical protein DXG01_003837 [Tephrocybe rancida]|nr:hypothetical protein DXG01_003837 [Tephrocybe rancida]